MSKNIYLIVLLNLLAVCSWSQTFTELNGPFGGQVTNLVYDAANTKIYALVNKQLFVSTDNGVNWARLALPANIFGLDDLVLDGTKLVAIMNSSQIWQSADAGATWTKLSTFPGNIFYYKLLKLPTAGVFLAAGATSISVSVDNAVNWKSILDLGTFNGQLRINDIKITSAGDIFASDATIGLRKYPHPANMTDLNSWAEANWVTVFAKQYTSTDYWAHIGISANNRIFFNHENSNGVDMPIEFSDDLGATWQTQALPGWTPHNINNAVWAGAPNGKMYLFENGFYRVWEFTEGAGTPWVAKPWATVSTSNQDVTCAFWRSNTQAFAGANTDGVFSTSNTGNSWSISSTGLKFGDGEQVETTTDGKILVVQGVAPQMLWYSTDQGATWLTQSFADRISKLYRLPDNTLIITTDNQKNYTSTDGINWTPHSNPPGITMMRAIVIVATNDIYGFGDGGTVWESLDKGVTWNQIALTAGMSATEQFTYATRDDDGIFYVHTSDNTNATKYHKLDSNVTPWAVTSFSFDANNFIPFALFTLNNKVYIGNGGRLFSSSDKGVTWKDLIAAGDKVFPLKQGALNGIAITAQGYLSITQNEGQTVVNIPLTQAKGIITDVALNAASTKYIASARNSPALEFAISSTNKMLLQPSEIPQYVNFNWQPVAGGPFGGVTSKVVRSSTGQLYAKGGIRLYKYNSTTSGWDVIMNSNVINFCLDASDKIYVAGGNSILVSSNNGTSFSEVTYPSINTSAQEILVNDVGNILMPTTNGIFRSTDNGANFTKTDDGYYSNLVMATDGTLLAQRTTNNFQTKAIVRSTDKGVTWSVTGSAFTSLNNQITLSALEAGKLAAVAGANMYMSADAGATWTSILGNIPVGSFVFGSDSRVIPGPSNSYLFFWTKPSTGTTIYSSTDGGTTWTKKSDQPYIMTSAIYSGTDVYAGTQANYQSSFSAPSFPANGIVKSSDNGVTFAAFQNNKGLANNRFGGADIYKSKLYVVCNGFLYSSTDKGQTLTQITTAGTAIQGVLKTPDGALLAYGKGVYKTTDGTTWTQQTATGDFVQMTAATASLYYGVDSQNKFYSSTNLTTWTQLTITGLVANTSIVSIASDASGVLYFIAYSFSQAGASNIAYQFASGTLTQVPITLGLSANLNSVGNKIYLYSSDGLVYSTTDGLTWASKGLPQGFKLIISSALNYYFITNGNELFVSRDQGSTWQSVGLPYSSGIYFDAVMVDEFTGLAYGWGNNTPLLKSSGIVLLNDNKGPGLATLSPANLATGIVPTAKLTITFDEAATPVAGKKIKIVDPANTSGFVESIDVSAGVVADRSITFTPAATTLKYSANASTLQSYFVTLEAGAFGDLFGNTNAAVINDATWKFTMAVTPDATPPAITFDNSGKTNYLNIQDNNKTVQATITDAVGVAQAQIFYRMITTNNAFASSNLSNTSGNIYQFAVPSSAYGPIGLEFYITAADAAGNTTRSPQSGSYFAYKNVDVSKPTVSPSLPAGALEEHYRIISVPYASSSMTVESVLVPALGQRDAKIWRLLTLNSAKTGWDEYPKDFTTIQPGVGYWIIYKNGGAVALSVETTPSVTKTTPSTLTLAPGWNQVGNVYPFNMVWAEVLTANSNPAGVGTLKAFRGSGYVNTDAISPTEGAFVFNSGSANVVLTIPLVTSASGGRRGVEFDSDLSQSQWIVPLSLSSQSRYTNIGGIGMSENAKAGIDDLDDFNPPSLHTVFQMDFTQPGLTKKIARDVVNTQESYTWNFNVNTTTGERTDLQWNNENFGNSAKELYLFDVALQTLVNMREQNHYSFDPSVSSAFRIYFGENLESKIKPDFVLLGDAYPNPSVGHTTIPFTLPDSAPLLNVRLEVYDILGKKVGTLQDGELEPGFHSLQWNSTGNEGIYLYRLTVSSSGASSVQTKKIIIKQ
ncbi:hypothetical protein WSM22_35650 [Cytophagales bacterium WSM2-2]|nr:hypothetical protein WSM22_35650 [Cytophagales bacterium WSM2-2]